MRAAISGSTCERVAVFSISGAPVREKRLVAHALVASHPLWAPGLRPDGRAVGSLPLDGCAATEALPAFGGEARLARQRSHPGDDRAVPGLPPRQQRRGVAPLQRGAARA